MLEQDVQLIVEQTMEKYEKYVNPGMARLFRYMGLSTIEWESKGSIVTDLKGDQYLDLLGGYGMYGAGHSHPKIIAAVKEQLDRMAMPTKLLLNKPMADLSELLAQITPGDLQYSFLCNSGTEAVEAALKLARLSQKKTGIISTMGAFHGKSLGALSATGREIFRTPFLPLIPGFTHVPYGDAEAIERAINEDTAAVIVEPIQGEGGVIVPPKGYLKALREICDRKDILLIVDEVQTGMGRTGKVFGVDHEGVVPDIMCLAKALGGGIMPIGAIVARQHLWEGFADAPFLHTSTFGGNPLACAAAIAAIKVMLEENLPQKAVERGDQFLKALHKWQAQYPDFIAEVRGMGLIIGIEFTDDGYAGFTISEMVNNKILAAYTLNNPKVIRIEPPLVITEEEVSRALAAFEKIFNAAQELKTDL
ncbi:MAG: putrescine aminotransferase [Bacillota bacterium]|nr:MAG: putrescine aminotransferase [Bacillota bacterium]MBS3950084.1 aminotransferase class III-fold pyridoxal phosphate-dependent enzyme [Peptococcaceae bacterium]